MPRVPEGNFKLNASKRVENVQVPAIKTDVSKLRQLGGQFLKISETMEQAQTRADNLEQVSSIEKDLDQSVLPDIESLKQFSVSGKFEKTGADGKPAKVPLTEGVQERLSQFQTDAIAKLKSGKDSTEALQYYSKFIAPKVDRVMRDAERTQTAQIVQGTSTQLDQDISTHIQRYIDGQTTPEDRLGLQQKIISSTGVLDKARVDRKLMTLQQGIAAGAKERMQRNFKEDVIQSSRADIASIPNEAIRRNFLRDFDFSVEKRRKQITDAFYEKDLPDALEIKTNREYALKKGKLDQYRDHMEKAPLSLGETGDMRLNGYSKLAGVQLSMDVFAQKADINLKEDLKNPEGLIQKALDARLNAISDSYIAKLSKETGRSPSEVSKSLAGKIEREFLLGLQKMQNFRGSDYGGYVLENAPSIMSNITSQDPNRKAIGYNDFFEFARKAGVNASDMRLVGLVQAEGIANTVEQYKKGQDPDGTKFRDDMQLFANSYGDFSDKAFVDLINLTSGENKKSRVDPVALYITKTGDLALRDSIVAGYAKYETHLAFMGSNEFITRTKGGHLSMPKTSFETKVEQAMLKTDFAGLYYGDAGQTAPHYFGAVQSVKYLAAQIIAQGDGSVTVEDGITTARDMIMAEFPTVKGSKGSLSMDRAYAKKHNITPDAMRAMIPSMAKLKYIENIGQGLSIKAMKKVAEHNPALMTAITGYETEIKKGSGKANQRIVSLFEDNIVVMKDPAKANHATLGFVDPKKPSKPIPLFTEKKIRGDEGKDQFVSVPISIDISKYYEAWGGGELLELQPQQERLGRRR
jgi:hypothetical protein